MTVFDDALKGTLTESALTQYTQSNKIDTEDAKLQCTLLAAAAMKGRQDTVKLLLDSGAAPNAPSGKWSRPPLWFAAGPGIRKSDQAAVIRLLVAKGGDLDQKEGRADITPVMRAVGECKDPDIISLMVDLGADLTVKNNAGQTAVDMAKKKGKTAVIGSLRNKNDRAADRGKFVDRVVAVVVHVVAWVNLTVASAKKGLLKAWNNISGRLYDPLVKKSKKKSGTTTTTNTTTTNTTNVANGKTPDLGDADGADSDISGPTAVPQAQEDSPNPAANGKKSEAEEIEEQKKEILEFVGERGMDKFFPTSLQPLSASASLGHPR